MEVIKLQGVRLGSGCVEELDILEFRCRTDDVILMTEGIREDQLAALFHKVGSCAVAGFVLGNVGLH